MFDRDLPTLARAAARRPMQVATIFPTSRALAERLLATIDFSRVGRLVELGPGTGAITRVLLERLPPERYLGVEIDPGLVLHLREHHPDASFIEGSALELGRLVEPRSVDVVVSSLPWSVLPRGEQQRGLAGVREALRPGGAFLTYVCLNAMAYPSTHTLLALLKERFARVTREGLEWRNVPPAIVLRGEAPRGVDIPETTP